MVVLTTKPYEQAYCEIFFPCTESGLNPDGSGSMVDVIRGATWTPSVGGAGCTLTNDLTTPSNSVYSAFPGTTASQTLSAGTWPNFKQRPVIVFGCGRVVDSATVRMPIGQGDALVPPNGGAISVSFVGTGGMHMLINVASSQQITATSEATIFAPAVGSDVGLVLEWDGLTMIAKAIHEDGSIYESNGLDTTLTDTRGGVPEDVNPGLNNKTRFGGMAWYGIAAFSFASALPSNRERMYLEMFTNWKAGNRVLPSEWRYSSPPA